MALTTQNLAQFIGTEFWYRIPGTKITYTDGVKHVAGEGNAYWLIDLIVSHQGALKDQYFQVWKLRVSDNQGKITCTDGNENFLMSQEIPFTDFPLPEVTLWLTDNVILLPSEY